MQRDDTLSATSRRRWGHDLKRPQRTLKCPSETINQASNSGHYTAASGAGIVKREASETIKRVDRLKATWVALSRCHKHLNIVGRTSKLTVETEFAVLAILLVYNSDGHRTKSEIGIHFYHRRMGCVKQNHRTKWRQAFIAKAIVKSQVCYIHCELEKTHLKCFCHYLSQNPVDSDKIWYILSWINLRYNSFDNSFDSSPE